MTLKDIWIKDGVLMAVALVALVISFLWSVETLPDVPLCTLYSFTGIPCGGCGLTRAFCAISHGQFAQAWSFNPFGFVFYGIAIVLLFRPALRRWTPRLQGRIFGGRFLLCFAGILVTVMTLFGFARALRMYGVW